jgi:5-methyltetrahydropteroyltriglutamate--homocysteine methyltransferase
VALREARAQHAAGILSAEALRQVEDRYIREAIRMQEQIGLQAVTDGEYRRAFWHYDLLAGLDGVEMVEVATGIQFSGGAHGRLLLQSRADSVTPPTIWRTILPF